MHADEHLTSTLEPAHTECVHGRRKEGGPWKRALSGLALRVRVRLCGQPDTHVGERAHVHKDSSQSVQPFSSSLCKHLSAALGRDRNSPDKVLKIVRAHTHTHTQNLGYQVRYLSLFPVGASIGCSLLFPKVIST